MHVFQASLTRDGLSGWSARFQDAHLERRYIRHLVDTTLPNERLLWWAVIFTFLGYAILDVLTITQNLRDVLILRAITGAILVVMFPLSYLKRIKPHFGWLSAFGLWFSSVSIIAMISIIPPAGAPPYIIGVLVCFIASSCIMRIPFPVAAGAYLSVSLIYVLVLNFNPAFSRVDVISGHFFMISIATVAVATNYLQELRSRIMWLRDTQRQRDQETIEKLLIEATAADQSKINFLSMMSHELRTPLHQIIGYTEVVSNAVKTQGDNAVKLAHLDEIHGSARILLGRIQKMLRFADATAGKMKYEIVDTPVSELVDVALEQTRKGFDHKNLTSDTSGLKSGVIDIDIVHTCYALNNIIENAVNASHQDGVIRISGEKTEDGGYELRVTDEGRGMTAEQIEKALKPFTQGESALVRAREGLGLGLTLARHILNDQNATISLASEPEKGATVAIRFPASARAAAPVKAKAAAAG